MLLEQELPIDPYAGHHQGLPVVLVQVPQRRQEQVLLERTAVEVGSKELLLSFRALSVADADLDSDL